MRIANKNHSFPKKLKDNAAHFYGDISYPGDSINQEYKEGILVGYRWHDTKKIKPLFPFGFGLSYSSFDLTDITTDKKSYTPKSQIKVTCTVANTGTEDGAEVVQVYVGKSKSKVQRAFKELKGFNKVNLNAGEQKTVEILINTDDLSFYNESTANWQLETGNYYIYVGNASDNITKKIKFTIN